MKTTPLHCSLAGQISNHGKHLLSLHCRIERLRMHMKAWEWQWNIKPLLWDTKKKVCCSNIQRAIAIKRHGCNSHMVLCLIYTPATGGEDYDGPSTTFKGRFYSSDGGDLCGVRRKGSEATQLLKQLLVKNGCLCLPADLRGGVGDMGEGEWRATKADVMEWTLHAHNHTHRVHHCNCFYRKHSLGGFPR